METGDISQHRIDNIQEALTQHHHNRRKHQIISTKTRVLTFLTPVQHCYRNKTSEGDQGKNKKLK